MIWMATKVKKAMTDVYAARLFPIKKWLVAAETVHEHAFLDCMYTQRKVNELQDEKLALTETLSRNEIQLLNIREAVKYFVNILRDSVGPEKFALFVSLDPCVKSGQSAADQTRGRFSSTTDWEYLADGWDPAFVRDSRRRALEPIETRIN